MNTVKTASKKFICLECKNECDLNPKPYLVGDIFECPMCGIEYEVTNIDPQGEYDLQIIEEEK